MRSKKYQCKYQCKYLNYFSIKTLKEFFSIVECVLLLKDNRIALGFLDGQIQILLRAQAKHSRIMSIRQ